MIIILILGSFLNWAKMLKKI